MVNDRFVPVVSYSRGRVVLVLPTYHYRRVWPKKGARVMVDKDILSSSIYDAGVETMFKEGMLWIDDKDFRIELGLEQPEIEGEEPAEPSIILLDDKLLQRIIKLMPVAEVKLTLDKLNRDQLSEVADYAVAHYDELKMDRVDLLTEKTGINILKAIEFKKDMEMPHD